MTLQDYNNHFAYPLTKRVIIFAESGLLIENDNIVSEHMSLESSLCSESNVRYGRCEASCFKVQIADMNHNFVGEWLDVFIDTYVDPVRIIDNSNNALVTSDGDNLVADEPTIWRYKIGRFKVFSDEPSGDRRWRNLTCYDVMYDILNTDVLPWYRTVTFPILMRNLRASLFTYLGVEQKLETESLINDDLVVQGNFSSNEVMSGKSIVEAICELNGVFGHINNEGIFEYVDLYRGGIGSVTLNHYIDGTFTYEDYRSAEITGVWYKGSDEDAGMLIGTSDNAYVIQSNPFLFGYEGSQTMRTVLQRIRAQITPVRFEQYQLETYGNPALPLGAFILFRDSSSTAFSFKVMRKYMKGIQSLHDTFSSQTEEHQPTQVNSLQTELTRSKGKVHELVVDVNELTSTIYDEDTGLVSQIQQMSDEVVLKVKSDGTMVEVALGVDPSEGSSFQVKADNIEFISNGKIELTSNTLEINSTNFQVSSSGSITAKSGTIGGWTIGANKISAGDSTDGVAVVQRPYSDITWVFGAGGTSHSSYSDCAFKVSKNGSVFCKWLNITPNSTARTNGSGFWGFESTNTTTVLRLYNTSGSATVQLNGGSGYAEFKQLYVTGSKTRVVDTEDYGTRRLYCYETPSPMFGDLGEGQIAEDGCCYIPIEPVFGETVDVKDIEYQVYLQKYGEGDCYVAERKASYFVVRGTVGLSFGWEIKAKQIDLSQKRLEVHDKYEIQARDYATDAQEHINKIQEEREVA